MATPSEPRCVPPHRRELVLSFPNAFVGVDVTQRDGETHITMAHWERFPDGSYRRTALYHIRAE